VGVNRPKVHWSIILGCWVVDYPSRIATLHYTLTEAYEAAAKSVKKEPARV
jgi:hypothetical protein